MSGPILSIFLSKQYNDTICLSVVCTCAKNVYIVLAVSQTSPIPHEISSNAFLCHGETINFSLAKTLALVFCRQGLLTLKKK